jgi:hypothetical protein
MIKYPICLALAISVCSTFQLRRPASYCLGLQRRTSYMRRNSPNVGCSLLLRGSYRKMGMVQLTA